MCITIDRYYLLARSFRFKLCFRFFLFFLFYLLFLLLVCFVSFFKFSLFLSWQIFKMSPFFFTPNLPSYSALLQGTVKQIEKALINDCLRVWKVYWKFCILTISNFCSNLLVKFVIFLPIFKFLLSFLFVSKTLQINNLQN